MQNELSIEKGTLENASETLRFIQNVRTQIGLRALTADFVVGKWQGWFNVWLDLKNDPSETAQKAVEYGSAQRSRPSFERSPTVRKENIRACRTNRGHTDGCPRLYTRRNFIQICTFGCPANLCIYTTSQNPCWDIFTATRRRRCGRRLSGSTAYRTRTTYFVYYEPALTVFLDDRAQYEALLARKDEVVYDVYTLMRGKFPLDKLEKNLRLSDSDRGKHRSQNHPEVGHGPRPAQRHRRHEIAKKREKPPCIRSVIVPIAGKNWIFPSGTSARTAGSATGFYTAIGRRCCFC